MLRLAELRIASPCHERWADMVGDDRVRHCNACDRQVFDLSELTTEQAHALLATNGVTPCVRFRRRADGTVITSDCPTGVRQGRRRAVVAGAIAAGAALLGASAASADPLHVTFDAQTPGGIQGVVQDAVTGEPLVGATVVVSGPGIEGQLAEITDEHGRYTVSAVPPGTYVITIYYAETAQELADVQVTAGEPTVANAALTLAATGTITLDEGYYTMGLPADSTYSGVTLDQSYTMGIPVMPTYYEVTPRRPRIEWSSWVRVGFGAEEHAPPGVARLIEPQPADRDATWEAALGADLSLGVADHGDLRLGAWAEVRTSSGPVVGAEWLVERPGVLALRVGAGADVVTGAIAYGSRRVGLVVSATRSLDDPRDWSATAGVEVDPVAALRRLLR